eukprot:COSAG04_NODE_28772_length_273_cov_0.896552_1_plen_26_part_01
MAITCVHTVCAGHVSFARHGRLQFVP